MALPFAHVFSQNCIIDMTALEGILRPRSFYIFIVPRSGSTLLTDVAIQAEVLGRPQEWFNIGWMEGREIALGCKPPAIAGVEDINRYFATFAGNSDCTSVQFDYYQLMSVMNSCSGDFFDCKPTASFYLRRIDIVMQAVSLYRSVESGYWHSFEESEERRLEFHNVMFDKVKIENWIKYLIDIEIRFAALFREKKIDPVPLFYESFIEDQSAILSELSSRVEVVLPEKLYVPSLRRISDYRNQEWAERIREELSGELKSVIHARWLDLMNIIRQ